MKDRIAELVDEGRDIYNQFIEMNFMGMPEEWEEIHDEYHYLFTDSYLDERAEQIAEEITESELDNTGQADNFNPDKVREVLNEHLYALATEGVQSEVNVVFKDGLNRFIPKEIDDYTDGSTISFNDAKDYIGSDLNFESLVTALNIGDYEPSEPAEFESLGFDSSDEEFLIYELEIAIGSAVDEMSALERHVEKLWTRIVSAYEIIEYELDNIEGSVSVFNNF